MARSQKSRTAAAALSALVLFACMGISFATYGQCPSEILPTGLYFVRIWDIGVDVLGEPTWTGHVILSQESCDHFTGEWVEYNDHFSAFYSTATRLLTGGWYSTRDHLWGGINFHWDGVRLTGRWTWYGRDGTGYEEWFPVGDDYVIPPLEAPAPGEGDL